MYLENQLAAIGGIKFSDKVPTAGVTKEELLVNKSFYDSLNDVEQRFLIEHELLHLIFKHHSRFPNSSIYENVASDLAINSLLKKRFCGNKDPRDVIPHLYATGCFPCKQSLPDGETTDWYLKAIDIPHFSLTPNGFGGKLNKELASLEEGIGDILAGDSTLDIAVKILKKKERYSFSQLVQTLVGNRSYRNDYGYVERFGRNRKFDSLLPSSVLSEGDVRIRKNNILLFLDFSGSCRSMASDFVSAADSIPQKLFNINKFKFGTHVVPFESSACGSGTCYDAIHQKVSYFKYDMVWIFTDGYSRFSAEIKDTDKWHWFLCKNSTTETIPRGSHIHFLDLLKRN